MNRFKNLLPVALSASLGFVLVGHFALSAAAKPSANTAPYPLGNPVIRHLYTADAAPKVMPDGRVWMVTSVDHEDGGGYATMHAVRAFSSADMVTWIDHGEILGLADLGETPGEDWAIWAPDIIYRHGAYYLYFPMRNLRADGSIDRYVAVAESDRMDRRFTITNPRMRGVPTAGLDPAVFVDDDGTAYLYWNQTFMGVLRSDMREVEGTPFKLDIGAKNFMEAAWMHKRNGRYYFSYHTKYGNKLDSANPDDPTRAKSHLDWSWGDSPLGPLQHGGILNHELGVGVTHGPKHPGRDYVPWRLTQSNHGGIVEFHGQDYLFYHNSALSSWRQQKFQGPGTWTQRSVCIDYVNYAPDGAVIPVQQTIGGVKPVSVNQPYEIKLASRTALTGNHAVFAEVPLGTGYYYFDATLHAPVDFSGALEIRIDSPTGPLVGTCLITPELLKKRSGLIDTFIRDAKQTRDVYVVLRPAPGFSSECVALISPRFFAGAPLPH